MSLHSTHVVPAPRSEVWEWHNRKGAVLRLSPPFFPFNPISEAESLSTGTTVFALPAGLKWVARHDLSGYVAGRQFTDICATAPIQVLANWRHTHIFDDTSIDDIQATAITDDVRTRLPSLSLNPMFAYRQHQIINDFQAKARFEVISDRKLRVAITGSNGTVGRALAAQLSTLGHTVIPLVRSNPEGDQRLWDPECPDKKLLENVDLLVHLAGEPIFGRFSEAHKKALWDSRVEPTRKLAQLVAQSDDCHTMISGSTIGVYGHDRSGETLDEESDTGEGFLADLARNWEAATSPASEGGKRVVNLRTGIVISGRGGFLPVMRTLFSTGLGGHLSDGSQGFSWIALDDLTDIIITAALDGHISGPINATSPNPVTNAEMSKMLGAQLRRPAIFPVPTLGPKILLGSQGAEEFALADQRVLPRVLLAREHIFRYPGLEQALAHELGNEELVDAS
ncbi:TIGR01777 family oxidoreductase [Corynebacterium sp. ES2794-CONJ1]|uniref:TIGR01777 family oxidoreductase n=1 Tax=unclassified Corynebacterium TaxID=2624378 RepID=UPI002167A8FE|nr:MULTISPECIES: TIGR01777 family oxidoreductase [unclassified Corynebacterium]MCS4489262.1 TIGR01777 family oxidoreductase [Corynebacterium sp. ES2775-CONJ]MCS4491075.1 TIGR01777 family oxidoreductase [Corynebacterium sp. ES2715-CONJ3]MCS4531044.1 TIGR01777 family oxidoreductase [Corynebacterium sp. ES2730-CONJ]MCU9518411.1 TIGR01777 family oxidoreductase [Corynebacterium sp. ES2794-CONJ1]